MERGPTPHAEAPDPLAQLRWAAMQEQLLKWQHEISRYPVGKLILNFAHQQVKVELHVSEPPLLTPRPPDVYS